ncbi:MAG TPA: Rieske 2Fe-2S domain-containing protein [Bryobacteraceae bacterium]|nr:Rieske 2Fe-2S domain-containing protein [Bryobacteraceae bacterium]
MSVSYLAVGWNRTKKIYDSILAGGLALYLALFVGVGSLVHPNATAETLLIRGLGTAALFLLHVILCIGPLCRLDRRFLPLLYNRRHLGVTMFVLALGHGAFSIFQFHALGDLNPLVSLFVSNTRFFSLADFPFQILGFFALAILFLMAVTSHDFWLNNLTAPVWKRIHMLVYAAYGLLIAHVTLGALQSETSPLLAAVLGVGLTVVLTLHIAAGIVENRKDRDRACGADGFVPVGTVDVIPENRACIVSCGGERVAIFKYKGRISAVSNVCQHQNGPLGEGKIIGGCITCPWHGYQYRPESGAAPAPFTEKVSTFRTRIVGRQIFIHPAPLPPGTAVPPSVIEYEQRV